MLLEVFVSVSTSTTGMTFVQLPLPGFGLSFALDIGVIFGVNLCCSIPGAFCKLGFDRSSSWIIVSERLVVRSSNYSGERINWKTFVNGTSSNLIDPLLNALNFWSLNDAVMRLCLPGNGNWTNVIPVVDVETDTNTSSSEDELSTANQGNRKTTCELARESYEVYLVNKTTQANRETNRQSTR
jgi:hypothetical protein